MRRRFAILSCCAWLCWFPGGPANAGDPIEKAAAAPQPKVYGTLQSEPRRQQENYQAGLRIVCLEVIWAQFEPRQGVWDDAYIARMKAKKRAFEAAGMKVVLECGLQYPPDWIWTLPRSCYVNQYGVSFSKNGSPGMNSANLVFNGKMRELRSAYWKRVFQELGTDFIAVRLGGGWYGELNYPPNRWEGKDNCYWAYDPIAQGQAEGLPAGMKPCPVPGWKPAASSKDHSSARQFLNWYLDCLKNYHDWQIESTRRLFAGRLLMLYPGFGVRPGQVEAAIARDLNGSTSAEKNGEIQRGFDFARYIDGIKDPKVVVYCTWVDCQFGNAASSNPVNWPTPYFLADLARRKGLETWGENTGPGPLKIMERCFEVMDRCGMTGFLWAFEPQLYDGRHATIADYKRLIASRRAQK